METRSPIFVQKFAAAAKARRMTYREVGKRSGIDPEQIYNLTRKGNMPRLDRAVAIARALRIPMEYLSDDAVPIEPVPDGPASQVPTGDLCDEVVRRFHAEAERLSRLFDEAEGMDFKVGLNVLAGRQSLDESSLSQKAFARMKRLAIEIGVRPTWCLAVLSGGEAMQTKNESKQSILAVIIKRHTRLCEKTPGFEAFILRCHLDEQA